MKFLKAIAVFLAAMLLMGAVPSAPASAEGESWSIFVYMCGSDLESNGGAASANLQEAAQVDYPDNVTVLVQTGGARSWHTPGLDASKLQRFVVQHGKLAMVDEQPSASMGDVNTLGSFLRYGVQNYPADHYMVVFWNHGSGSVGGVCFDELYNSDRLSLSELNKGLGMAGVNFDLIGFDTCLMASLELASAVAPHGKYLIASEEYEPGGGWDYLGFLRYLSAHPGASYPDIGKAICDAYMAKCKRTRSDDMATLSVIDLAKIPAVAAAFDKMASEMNGTAKNVTTFRELTTAVKRAESYGGKSPREGYSNMVDLGDLVTQADTVLPKTGLNVLNSLFDAVKYNVKGRSRVNANGLSVFYPLGNISKNYLAMYFTDAAPSDNYRHYVQTVADYSGKVDVNSWADGSGYATDPADGGSWMESLLQLIGNSSGSGAQGTGSQGGLGGLESLLGSGQGSGSQGDLLGGLSSLLGGGSQDGQGAGSQEDLLGSLGSLLGGGGQGNSGQGGGVLGGLGSLLGGSQGSNGQGGGLGGLLNLFNLSGGGQGAFSWMQEDASYDWNSQNLLDKEDYKVSFENYITEDGTYALIINKGLESVESVNYVLNYIDYDYSEYMTMGQDNDIDANWDKGYFYDNFRGVWPTIDGVWCAPVLIAEEDTYNLYTVPVMLNGKNANLRVAYWFDKDPKVDGHFEVLGAWDGLDTDFGISGRNIHKLVDGDKVSFLFDSTNWDTQKTSTNQLETITIKGEPVMEESQLNDGEYEFYYVVNDTFGNTYYSDSIKLTVSNGNITLSNL